MTEKKATVLLSGGIDSVSCAHLLKKKGFSVSAVFVDYGQASLHQECIAVEKIKDELEIEVKYIVTTAPKMDDHGEIIGRNAFLIFSAIFSAEVHSGLLAIGIHSGTPYYDCSKNFITQMENIVSEYCNGRLSLIAPFVDWDKSSVYQYFRETGIPIEMTYSCESGAFPPCKQCASCIDRSMF
ncbi:7-cyano-7-deazaguanine synthase [Thiomicrorhabdus sp.]|uniref:7-cyano-7-deazaguanine synthase n=1 Tax=Thiomicrorhabdus sp. TaxID=2039724 RepID=UPI002AA79A7C|nr:7-cyano-7-deazaguanine synthase [Thiomicrorhabdus sp.]